MQLQMISNLLWPILVLCPLIATGLSQSKYGWKIAETFSAISLLAALLGWITLIPLGITFSAVDWLAITPLRATLLVLVSFIGFIVVHYANTNFDSDPDSAHFLRWLMLTIFAVMLTVSSNHLVLFWCAWVSISLSMHKLLIFYPTRYRAVLAAHKKFIFARTAELCLATALFLLYNHHNSFLISDVLQQYPGDDLSWQQQLAAVMIALVALIKCAQLPLHGWLIQVVESPTPVSALLHAGVINLGGFLILLFAPLFSQVPLAQWLVLIVGGLTASFAALVMATRISVKVRLAWSTTAQMGLMLVECGLGLYELALLHLIAHSCYKAHAFLRAGSAVSDDVQYQYIGKSQPSLRLWLVVTAIVTLILGALIFTLPIQPPLSPWVLLSVALIIMLSIRINQSITRPFVNSIVDVAVLAIAYTFFKFGAELLVPHINHPYMWQADLWISLLFVGVFSVYLFLQYQPLRKLPHKLFIALNAGFYLDEWATRVTLTIWPIHIPKINLTNYARQQSTSKGEL